MPSTTPQGPSADERRPGPSEAPVPAPPAVAVREVLAACAAAAAISTPPSAEPPEEQRPPRAA
ncbi:hypothetical protein [Peterkaempfera griseoplana]|uniref:hypothetical protein n=1 Tax=Peterkaempfera griseoplana TaxID=66896 RepID=UPI0006E2DE3A|nr:hypothetical protein [Peterkaempfera griseoplana]